MLTHSARFRSDLIESLQINRSVFANSEDQSIDTGYLEDEKVDQCKNKLFHNKWPSSFPEVVGHSKIIRRLFEILITESAPKILVFHGLRGVGKTSIAKIFGPKLSCEKFHFNKCIHETCLKCIHRSKQWFVDIDCAIRDPNLLIKFMKKAFGPSLFGKQPVFFLDEFNNDITKPVSRIMPRLVEDNEGVVIVGINEDIDSLDLGLTTRAEFFSFDPPSDIELTAWTLLYANTERIFINEVHALSIVTGSKNIPREILKNLMTLKHIDPKYYNIRLTELLKIQKSDVENYSAYLGANESSFKEALSSWNDLATRRQ